MGKVSKALNKAGTQREPGDGSGTAPGEKQGLSTPAVEHLQNAPVDIIADGDDKNAGLDNIHSPLQSTPDFTGNGQSTENWDERLVTASEKFSGIAESFRKLRTIILHPETGRPARTIMVLSADPQEGKSFISANLGISLAQGVDREALLIDCDLRRPSIHALFGLNNSRGLVDYLRGGSDLSTYMMPTGLANLSLIPSGPPPDNPAELLASDAMAAMMKNLLARGADNRMVVVDSPPFLAASETMILAQLVDKVVLVVRWGKSGRDNVKKVIDQIGRDKILGIVFNAFEMNMLDRKVQGVGYHNYYSDSYY